MVHEELPLPNKKEQSLPGFSHRALPEHRTRHHITHDGDDDNTIINKHDENHQDSN